jgi:hypothetical protein
MLVSLTLLFMVIAGMAAWSLTWVLPLGLAVFILAWLARPVAELRVAFDEFRRKVLLKENVSFNALLTVVGMTVVIYLIVPLVFYGLGRAVSAIIGAVF